MTSPINFATAKHKRDHPYNCAVSVEQELFAYSDGTVWPIRSWMGVDGEPCAKEEAAVCVAGGDDPNKGPWFMVPLADYGLGPLAAQAIEAATAGETPKSDSTEGESAVAKRCAQDTTS